MISMTHTEHRHTTRGRRQFRDFCAYFTPANQLVNSLIGWVPADCTVDQVAEWVATRDLDHHVWGHLFEMFGDMWMATEQYGREDAPEYPIRWAS